MKIEELMSRDPVAVGPETPLKDVAAILLEHRISGVPVIGERLEVLGVVSEADIISKKGKDVRAIMSKKVISVSEDATVEEVAQLMTTHAIKRLPVMNGAAIVGIVSRADIVSAIAQGEHVAIHTPIYDL